ncbi:hypothetical protein BDA99DRAFT_425950, partial [Phascolomyces articulosus]
FAEYVTAVLNSLTTLTNFYDGNTTSLRFLNYRGRQRACAEMINILIDGGKKYNRHPIHVKRRK